MRAVCESMPVMNTIPNQKRPEQTRTEQETKYLDVSASVAHHRQTDRPQLLSSPWYELCWWIPRTQVASNRRVCARSQQKRVHKGPKTRWDRRPRCLAGIALVGFRRQLLGLLRRLPRTLRQLLNALGDSLGLLGCLLRVGLPLFQGFLQLRPRIILLPILHLDLDPLLLLLLEEILEEKLRLRLPFRSFRLRSGFHRRLRLLLGRCRGGLRLLLRRGLHSWGLRCLRRGLHCRGLHCRGLRRWGLRNWGLGCLRF